jgi:hypothetical protein
MSAEHTPGPWFIWQELAMQREGCEPDEINDELLQDGEFCIYSGNPIECTRGSLRGHTAHICDVDADNFDFGDDDEAIKTTALANARLIAAAPDLLEAAKLALQSAESWIHDQLDGTSSLESALAKLEPVRAAIAKATGGQA